MSTLSFLTFDLLIEKNGDGYRARVVDSPKGQPSALFNSPFAAGEANDLLARVGRRGPIAGTTVKLADEVKQFGGRLFDAVFSGEVLTGYRRSRDAAEEAGKGLRLKLRLSDVPELADLPWEYLYDATRSKFLALSKETPVVRFLEFPEGVTPLAVKPPLNILVVLASPSDYEALDVEGEWARMQGALKDLVQQNKVTLTRVAPPTLNSLLGYLRRAPYHILHFIGHGEFSKTAGQGALVLVGDDGKGQKESEEKIATLLNDARSLRFVVLNACEGARTSASNPFAGVAPRLVAQGIPAVLAMQFPISDPAALDFTTGLYSTLADGYPVDAAVNEARLAMYSDGSIAEWGTPVLFMRAADGILFATEEEMGQPDKTEPPAPRHGGITFGGNAQVHVGGDIVSGDKNVSGDEYNVQGDVNTVTIGAGAQVGQVAAGRNITQTQGGAANEAAELAQKLGDVNRALQAARAGIDPSKLALAEFQFTLLQSEVTRTEGTPSGTTIAQAADGLLASAPMLRDSLQALFTSSSGKQLLARAGAADWAKQRFG